MNDQTIPAEKVRELKTKYEYDTSGDPERLLDRLLHDLDDLLPTPPQPTTGLLGRWAKHPEHGDVMCVWDKPQDGWINTYKRANNGVTGVEWHQIRFSDLTFPEQATKPEDVPAGEAWLVELLGGGEQRALKTDKDEWQTSSSNPLAVYNVPDDNITLIAPLTPERPGKGDEQPDQPVWRIEHDWRNLRFGEYIIDRDDTTGTVIVVSSWACDTDGDAYGTSKYSPWIVFHNKAAATPEAIEEAKKARDKELNND